MAETYVLVWAVVAATGFVLWAISIYIMIRRRRNQIGYKRPSPFSSTKFHYTHGLRNVARVIFYGLPLVSVTTLGWYRLGIWQSRPELLIAIAEFHGPQPSDYRLTETIVESLRRATAEFSDIEVMQVGRSVPLTGSGEARKLADQIGARMLIWGWYGRTAHSLMTSVHVELRPKPKYLPLKQRQQFLRAPVAALESFTFQLDLAREVNYVGLVVGGVIRYERGDYPGAIERLSKALAEGRPGGDFVPRAAIHFFRGNSYYFMGQAAKAADDYTVAKALEPRSPSPYYALGTVLLDRQDYEGAIIEFRLAIARFAGSEAYNNLGSALWALGRYADAINTFTAGLRRRGNHQPLLSNRGLANAALGKWPEAIADYDRALRMGSGDGNVLANRGNARREMGDREGAERDFVEALRINSRSCSALNGMAVLHRDRGNAAAARAAWMTAVTAGAPCPEAYVNMAGVAVREGRTNEAMSFYARALEIRASIPEAYYSRAVALRKQGNLHAATEDCEEALRLRPHYAEALNLLGLIRNDQGDFEQAIEYFDRAIAVKGDLAEAYNNRGAALLSLGFLSRALGDFSRCIALDSRNAEAHHNSGNVLERMGRHEDAINKYVTAIALRPKYVNAYVGRAGALKALGRWREAIRDYTTAIQLDPNHAPSYYNRGNIHLERRQWDLAIKDYERDLRLRPTHEDAYFNRAACYAATGRRREALEDLKRALGVTTNPRHRRQILTQIEALEQGL